MGHWIRLVSLTTLLQGCATQFDMRAATGTAEPEAAAARPVVRFQNSSIKPRSTDVLLTPGDLQPGDIILSSMLSLRSAGIQLITLAPVSHAAVYIGERQVAEAVGAGVRVRGIDQLLAEETVVLALRYPGLGAEHAQEIRDFLLRQVGTNFNYFGVAVHIPFSIYRRVCELPLIPSTLRDACIRGIGGIHHLATSKREFFCSQLVLQAYRHAGVPITDADPRLISPADILHMREGDVSAFRIHKQLRQIGHLKYEPPVRVAHQH